MPRLYLALRRRPGRVIGGYLLQPIRLVALVRIGGPGATVHRDAVLDTGANLCVFPRLVWRQLQSRIQWLTKPDDKSVPESHRRIEGIGGGTIPVRIGVVDLQFFDQRSFPPRAGRASPVVAMFAQDRGELKETILGLGGGVFAGRRLVMEYDRDEAWIEE